MSPRPQKGPYRQRGSAPQVADRGSVHPCSEGGYFRLIREPGPFHALAGRQMARRVGHRGRTRSPQSYLCSPARFLRPRAEKIEVVAGGHKEVYAITFPSVKPCSCKVRSQLTDETKARQAVVDRDTRGHRFSGAGRAGQSRFRRLREDRAHGSDARWRSLAHTGLQAGQAERARCRSSSSGHRTALTTEHPLRWGSYLKDMADDGYLFAFQDIRGRYKSEGTFVMIRSPRETGQPKAIDEGTDAFDTIDWLVKNVKENNGRVGMLGISYPGWLTVMALLEPHPALKAASPQAPPADMFLGDDFHHNGAFRLSYGFEYAALMETSKENSPFTFDRRDTFEWYLRLGPLSNANARYLKGKIPTWNDFVEHSSYDEFWRKQAAAPYLGRPRVPTLNVAGWWDQEDFYGPLKVYETFEKHDPERKNFLVVGPWNHGGWAHGDGDKLGPVEFGSATAKAFPGQDPGPLVRGAAQRPWLAELPRGHDVPHRIEHLADL